VREIRTLRAMWRALETESRQLLNGQFDDRPHSFKQKESVDLSRRTDRFHGCSCRLNAEAPEMCGSSRSRLPERVVRNASVWA
jgi:hypothetical protein